MLETLHVETVRRNKEYKTNDKVEHTHTHTHIERDRKRETKQKQNPTQNDRLIANVEDTKQ